MSHKVSLIFLLILSLPISARADSCGPGYYYNANNECVACQSNHYCTGDGIMRPCPEFTYDNITDLYSMVIGYNVHSIASAGVVTGVAYVGYQMTDIEHCLVLFSDVEVDEGVMSEYRLYYSTTTNEYSNARPMYWTHANPGYYLSPAVSWSPAAIWYGAKACTNSHPANSHYSGPGTPDSKDGTIVNANDCPWECDAGYGRHGNECLPLCTAGITQLKTSTGISLNVYLNKTSTPAINIGYNNTVCYVNLEPGAGGLSFRYNNTVYHATD